MNVYYECHLLKNLRNCDKSQLSFWLFETPNDNFCGIRKSIIMSDENVRIVSITN